MFSRNDSSNPCQVAKFYVDLLEGKSVTQLTSSHTFLVFARPENIAGKPLSEVSHGIFIDHLDPDLGLAPVRQSQNKKNILMPFPSSNKPTPLALVWFSWLSILYI